MSLACPDCGAGYQKGEPRWTDEEPDLTVARRKTGFGAEITDLTELDRAAKIVELPCGCRILTVN